ncbi:MAG: endo-1,4-beta-xylanase [Planctomycetota bacterium]
MVIGQGGEEWRSFEQKLGELNSTASRQAVADAKENIEKIRKTDVELHLVDRNGEPLANTEIEVAQMRHHFPFGDNMWGLDTMYRFNEADTDKGRYWKLCFADVLNAANALCYWTERPRNDGPKTEDIQGYPKLDGFHYCVDWAASQGLTVKGHPLFWSIQKCVPEWVKRYDYETQLKFAEVRVRQLIAGVRGRVKIWDVVNEALWEPAFKNLPQRRWPHIESTEDMVEYIAPVIQWARDEDPDAIYVLNDYGLTEDREHKGPDGVITSAMQRERMLDLVAGLDDAGACPSAIGLQSHTGGWVDHARQQAVYDQLSQPGLPLHITEFWARTNVLEDTGLSEEDMQQAQADYVADFITTAFGHPSIEGFFFWGFMGSGIDWRGNSGHELTPMYHRVKKLLHEEWNTRQTLTTDEQGVVRFRGFYGDYSLRYAVNDHVQAGERFAVHSGQAPQQRIIAKCLRAR